MLRFTIVFQKTQGGQLPLALSALQRLLQNLNEKVRPLQKLLFLLSRSTRDCEA